MDNLIFNTKHNDEVLEEIDRKIVIKEYCERGKNKTVVVGLNLYEEFKNNNDIINFSKEIKNKFGCGCTITNENDIVKLVFQGKHKNNIKKTLTGKYKELKIE